MSPTNVSCSICHTREEKLSVGGDEIQPLNSSRSHGDGIPNVHNQQPAAFELLKNPQCSECLISLFLLK